MFTKKEKELIDKCNSLSEDKKDIEYDDFFKITKVDDETIHGCYDCIFQESTICNEINCGSYSHFSMKPKN